MMRPIRQLITPADFVTGPFHLLNDRWMLLTAGEAAPGRYNTMTIAWGGLGVLWDLPVAWTVVRPDRRTHDFMEASPDFTLAAFPDELHQALEMCGRTSGRDIDKVAQAGLTIQAATTVRSPGFIEADLLIECRKIHVQGLDAQGFIDRQLHDAQYGAGEPYHRFFIGQIVAITGSARYQAAGR